MDDVEALRVDSLAYRRGARSAALLHPASLLLAFAMWIAYTVGTAILETPATRLSVLAVVFLAALISSIAGFAFSALCAAPLLHLMSEPVMVVELMIVCSIAIQLLIVWSLLGSIRWSSLRPFIVGGVIGLPLGIQLLLHIPPRGFAIAMGSFLIGYGACMLCRPPIQLRRDWGWTGDGVAGLVGGVTGGLAGFPGALVTIWCSLKGWDKWQQRCVCQPYILIMQILALCLIMLMGPPAGHQSGLHALAYTPGALVGAACGLAIFDRLSDRQFAVAANLSLIIAGAGLLVR
ncbi:MAG TPA: sulfite exporter TauE/SafE family protein [Acetobacteraceae bacterium]|nr:sulfite exporter TauE/SafE family protein [Acetobacteraceae bacterium]